MAKPEETREARLARLEKELVDRKEALPEHCRGTDGYISDHRASPEHWQKIEDLEQEIEKLRAERRDGTTRGRGGHRPDCSQGSRGPLDGDAPVKPSTVIRLPVRAARATARPLRGTGPAISSGTLTVLSSES